MRTSYNDSGLTAKRSYRLLAAGLTASAVCLVSCKSFQPPLDDAYYYPEKKAAAVVVEQTPAAQTETTNQTVPTLEVVNQQDTTITVKITR